MLTLPPLSLYVHIPWCIRKCPYCDFNSHQADQKLPEQEYLHSLEEDLKKDLNYVQGRKLVSLFFGGGTPSLFSGRAICQVIAMADRLIGFEPHAEITLEANPGTVDQHYFKDYIAAGVNRISLGIQSFNPEHLKTLGRIHSGEDARHAIALLQKLGFENINLDLMHGLPGQTAHQAVEDIETALSFGPAHISWYQLTIEPNTAFYSKPPTLPDEEQLEAIQQTGQELLIANGFEQYEVSAWCQTGKQSRHNLNYWEFGDYLGIGAGAHSKITLAEQNALFRFNKTRMPQDYLNPEKAFYRAAEPVAEKDRPIEFLLNALRLKQGVPLPYFSQRTGLPWASIARQWNSLEARGLLQPAMNRLQTTNLGYRYLNSVLTELDK